MGLFDKIFGGGTRDEKSVQSDINKALKDSGGKWTKNLNDLVAERDRARSGATTSSSGRNALSQGLGSFGRAVSSIPGNIARDVKMGTSAGLFSGRDKQAETLKSKGFSQADIKDYFARTDATIARNAAQQDFGRSDRSNDAPFRAPIGGDGSPQNPTISGGKGSRTPQPTEISPEMRREALRIFESQRGAGQVPYQMQPYQQGLGSMPRPRFMPQGGMQRYAVPQQQMNERLRSLANRTPMDRPMLPPMQQPQIPRFQPMPQPRMPMSRVPDQYDGMRSTGFGNPSEGGQFAFDPQQQAMRERMMRNMNMARPEVMPPMQQPQIPRFRMPMPQPPMQRMPSMPMPQPPMQQNPNVSPAFQYAAQNYQRLGGSQRLMDRPMEMMSVAERQRINDMAQGMADRQRPTPFPGKGGGQLPTISPGKGGGAMLPQAFGGGIPAMGIAALLGRGRSF
jgi:hypothetical protein